MVASAARAVAKRPPGSGNPSAAQLVWRAVSAAVVARAAIHLLRHSLALRDQGEDHVGNDGDLEDITSQDYVGSSQSHFGMLGDCALGTSSLSPSANPVDL